MRPIDKAARFGERILSIISGIIAVILLIYSAYVLYDNFYTGQSAFASWDLLKYKPVIQEEDNKADFSEIAKINPDAVGWLTIYDTNIDYPVVQGKDDLEYASRNIYKKSSLTGAIYLSSMNSRGFDDSYNIIFGHHMDNGAMFGDIDNYIDMDYFISHRKGILMTPEKNYELSVFASMKTDAYETDVYSIPERAGRSMNDVISYIRSKSIIYMENNAEKISKIVVLSTCANASTNGRVVIFCEAVEKTEGISEVPAVPASTGKIIRGHDVYGHDGTDSWALLNAICVMLTLFTVLPLTKTGRKFRQLPYSKNKADEFGQYLNGKSIAPFGSNLEINGPVIKKLSLVADDLRRYYYGMIVGLILEIFVAAGAVIILFSRENFYAPMVLSNSYTGLMILIASTGLLIDFIFYRYRGVMPPEKWTEKLSYAA